MRVTPPIDVLVVGAGPVGLTMACELARNGVNCRIIDKAAAPATTSRALDIFPRTLEMFQIMGLIGPVLEAGHQLNGIAIYNLSGQIAHIGFCGLPSRYAGGYRQAGQPGDDGLRSRRRLNELCRDGRSPRAWLRGLGCAHRRRVRLGRAGAERYQRERTDPERHFPGNNALPARTLGAVRAVVVARLAPFRARLALPVAGLMSWRADPGAVAAAKRGLQCRPT